MYIIPIYQKYNRTVSRQSKNIFVDKEVANKVFMLYWQFTANLHCHICREVWCGQSSCLMDRIMYKVTVRIATKPIKQKKKVDDASKIGCVGCAGPL